MILGSAEGLEQGSSLYRLLDGRTRWNWRFDPVAHLRKAARPVVDQESGPSLRAGCRRSMSRWWAPVGLPDEGTAA